MQTLEERREAIAVYNISTKFLHFWTYLVPQRELWGTVVCCYRKKSRGQSVRPASFATKDFHQGNYAVAISPRKLTVKVQSLVK